MLAKKNSSRFLRSSEGFNDVIVLLSQTLEPTVILSNAFEELALRRISAKILRYAQDDRKERTEYHFCKHYHAFLLFLLIKAEGPNKCQ